MSHSFVIVRLRRMFLQLESPEHADVNVCVPVQQARPKKDSTFSPVVGLKTGAEGCARVMDVADLPRVFAR